MIDETNEMMIIFLKRIFLYQLTTKKQILFYFYREFAQIFDSGKSPANNTLIDCLLKSCLLCVLWYLSCYLIFRSMTILISVEIIILYSITVTSRQLLGWIFLHEQFIGNKVSLII